MLRDGRRKASRFDWTPLTGHVVIIVADNDAPGDKHAQQVYDILEPLADGVVVVHAAQGKDAADHVAAGYGLDEFQPIDMGGGRGRRLKVTRGSEVQTRRVTWIMPDWIPTGSLTLLAGREGLGKSTIAGSICAAITRGALEGELFGAPGMSSTSTPRTPGSSLSHRG
ncbi:hypothetical protein GCM10020255_039450 [Rhodococcus baikonurensis]